MIVGLTGRKGCGKSSVAKIFRDRLGYEILSFASPIKDMLRVLGLGDAELFDPVIKEIPLDEYGKSPRELMQILGTEFGRELICQNIWVTALEKRIDRNLNYVIDDVRFPNEAAMIHANGGKVVRVVRPDSDDQAALDAHVSETGLDSEQIDYELSNVSSSVLELENEAIRTLEDLIYYGAIYDSESLSLSGNSK